MALKTFNIDDSVYKHYSRHCKQKGISMSKQVENFLREEIEKIVNSNTGSKTEKADIDVGKIERDAKKFDKSLEHPLRKYC